MLCSSEILLVIVHDLLIRIPLLLTRRNSWRSLESKVIIREIGFLVRGNTAELCFWISFSMIISVWTTEFWTSRVACELWCVEVPLALLVLLVSCGVLVLVTLLTLPFVVVVSVVWRIVTSLVHGHTSVVVRGRRYEIWVAVVNGSLIGSKLFIVSHDIASNASNWAWIVFPPSSTELSRFHH